MTKISGQHLLYIGNITDIANAKMGTSALYFTPENCLGYYARPECSLSLDCPRLSIQEAKENGAENFVIAVVNNGGYIESEWIEDIETAIRSGLNIVNGMHEKLEDVPTASGQSSIAELATEHGVKLINLRHHDDSIAVGNGEKRQGTRVLTVGTDCGSGKMMSAIHLHRSLLAKNENSDFIATGQCGILVSGKGIAVDAVGADFISGAVELMTPDTDGFQIIEGQGSLSHPAYAGVSLGLLHGAQPDYLVVCHELGREKLKNFDYPVPSLKDCITRNIELGTLTNPQVSCLGISLNTSSLPEEEAKKNCKLLESEFKVPVTDPLRFGMDSITETLLSRCQNDS